MPLGYQLIRRTATAVIACGLGLGAGTAWAQALPDVATENNDAERIATTSTPDSAPLIAETIAPSPTDPATGSDDTNEGDVSPRVSNEETATPNTTVSPSTDSSTEPSSDPSDPVTDSPTTSTPSTDPDSVLPDPKPTTSPDPLEPEHTPLFDNGPSNQPPQIGPLPALTVRTKAELTDAMLYGDVVVYDDEDTDLRAQVTGWGGWYDTAGCPSGYPCTYTIIYSVTDSRGGFDDAARTITVTGPQSGDAQLPAHPGSDQPVPPRTPLVANTVPTSVSVDHTGSSEPSVSTQPIDTMANSGGDYRKVLGLVVLLVGVGTGFILVTRRRRLSSV